MFSALISRLNRIKISKKLIIFVMVLILIPMLLINFILLWQICGIYEGSSDRFYENALDQYIGNYSYKFDVYKAMMNNIISNGIVQSILSETEQYDRLDRILTNQQLNNEFNNMMIINTAPEVKKITMYILDPQFPFDGAYTQPFSDVAHQSWASNIDSNKTMVVYENNTLSIVKKIYSLNADNLYSQTSLGYLKLDLYIPSFFAMNDHASDGADDIVILSEKGEVIYQSNASSAQEFSFDANVVRGEYGKQRMNGNYVTYTKDGNNWTVVLNRNSTTLEEELRNIYIAIFLMNAALILLILLAIRIFSKTFTTRILQINEKMKRFAQGDLQMEADIDGEDEIAQMDQTFNQMIGRIMQLINENYANELEKKDLQLRALQFQINPHFLYNTLEVVNRLAITNHCDEISTIVQNLGAMFRYNVDSTTDFVSLKSEITHLKNYLEIQMLRYDNKFEVYYDIEEAAYQCKIVKFVLQPIVENALYHGIYKKEEYGVLEITAFCRDDKLQISVMDNGVGMSKERLTWLRSILDPSNDPLFPQTDESTIGMKNVSSRIHLLYGSNYGVSVKSKEQIGTKVTLTLPIEPDGRSIQDK